MMTFFSSGVRSRSATDSPVLAEALAGVVAAAAVGVGVMSDVNVGVDAEQAASARPTLTIAATVYRTDGKLLIPFIAIENINNRLRVANK
jgi:hypothetical protein